MKKLQVLSNDYQKLDSKFVQLSLDSLTQSTPIDCPKAEFEFLVIKGHLALSDGKTEDSFKYYGSALKLIKNEGESKKSMLRNIAFVHTRIEEFQKAIDLLDEAIHLPCPENSIDCQKVNAVLNVNIALNLRKLDRYEEAIQKYGIAEKILFKYEIRDSMIRASIFNSMGNIYDAQFSDYRKSLDTYKKGLDFVPKGHNANYAISTNIARMYRELNILDSANIFYNRTVQGTTIPRYLVTPYQGLAAIGLLEKDYEKAIKMYGLSLKNAEASNKKASIYRCQIYLTKSHFLNGDFQKARAYLNNAIELRKDKEISKQYQNEINRYAHMLDVAMLDPKLSNKIYQDFMNYDTAAISIKTESVNKSISKYEKLLLRDSLDRAVLKEENAAQKAKNYKLSSLALILGLLLSGGMAFQLKNLLKKQRSENDELVFEINELKSINLQLENQSHKNPDLDTESKIQIQIKDQVHIFDCHQIKYLKAEDFGTRIFLDDSSQWTDSSLKLLKTQFPENKFVQIFRSTIVNIDHIASINTVSLKLKDETELKIGRTYKRAIKDAVIKQEEE